MFDALRKRSFERLVVTALALLVTARLGVLLHAGRHPQLIA